jgi:hypothetical protein
MSTPPKRPKTVNRLQRLITYPDWSDRYATMAGSLDMPITDLDEAVEVVHALIHAIDTS